MSFDTSAIDVLSFDLDDTLWSGNQVLIKAEKAMHQWMMQNTPLVFERFSTHALRDHKIQFVKNNPQFKNKISDVRKAYLSSLFLQLNLPDYKEKAQQCFNVFYNARQQVELFDGVLDTLKTLKQHYRIIAITNGNADVELTGLGGYFELSLKAEDFNQPKPHPEIFETAMSQLQILPDQCLHIGDHPIHDMQGAYDLGMKTCWVKDGSRDWEQPFQPDLEVSHISELLTMLSRSK